MAPTGDGPGHGERALAKINLTLRVTGRRPDGFSELASIVAFADLGERLTLRPAAATSLTIRGADAGAIHPRDNTVIAADRAFRDAFPDRVPPVACELIKRIPVAAGLGGGSADAAAAIRGLARLAGLDAAEPRIAIVGARVGADVPVCLCSTASFVAGIGEVVRPLGAVPPFSALLVNPRRPLPTARVFARYWELNAGKPTGCATSLPPSDPRLLAGAVVGGANDLEPAARRCEPVIGEVLELIAGTPGCHAARMTGSGATCFGLYDDADAAEGARSIVESARPDWWARTGSLV